MSDNPALHPPRWSFTVYGIALASLHIALAVGDVGRAFDAWEMAWPFYSLLIGTTSLTAAVIDVGKRRYETEREVGMLRAQSHGDDDAPVA